MEQRELWDGFYRANGRAWRGNSRIPDPLSGDGRALDLGCGNGKTVSTLIDLGYRVTGTDFSETAVDMCRENFDDAAEFVASDIMDLPFGDASFDYVTAVHVLEHIDDSDMPAVAAEIRRVLRPGGYLFVRSFTPLDMRSGKRSSEGIRYIHRNPDGIVAFFRGMETEYARRVDEPTRFGTTRSRAECLFRKPADILKSDLRIRRTSTGCRASRGPRSATRGGDVTLRRSRAAEIHRRKCGARHPGRRPEGDQLSARVPNRMRAAHDSASSAL